MVQPFNFQFDKNTFDSHSLLFLLLLSIQKFKKNKSSNLPATIIEQNQNRTVSLMGCAYNDKLTHPAI